MEKAVTEIAKALVKIADAIKYNADYGKGGRRRV